MEKDLPDKAADIGRISAMGSTYLFAGKIASTIIAAVGTIILGLFILEGDYGLYTVALIPATTLILFQDWGVSSAITRKCAQCRVNNNEEELRKTIIAGLTFEIAIGLLLTLLSILTANILASAIFGQPSSALLMIIASASILSTAIFTVNQSIFVGFERMELIALVSILQAIVQSVSAPTLVMLGYGALGAIVGYVLTSIVGGLVSLIILYSSILKKIKHIEVNTRDLFKTLKPLLHFGLPLAIGSMLGGLLIQFNSLLMASYVKDLTMIGNYKVATNFAVLLTFFTVPITTVLFPAFSKLDPKKELNVVKTVFASSIKYGALLLVPATMILIVLSNPIIGVFYGNKWVAAHQFLALSVLINLFSCLGYLTLAYFFSGLGDTKTVFKMNVVQLLTGIPLALILIPWFGINGMIIGLLIAGIPSMFIYLYVAWKKYRVKIDYISSAKIFLASLLSAMVIYVFLNLFPFSNWIELAIGFLLFLVIYIISVSLFGAVKQNDIRNLRAMFRGLGVISKILDIPLILMELLIKKSSRA